ncbi:MAG: BMP family ABC transporter substrate-binding protein [Chloroflexi bacterium]|nr:BMP family ABC transporter substrate-binding protein [Chloroflexota bacterium]
MSKKLFVVLSVLLVASFALTACATPTAAPTAAPVVAPTAAPTAAPTVAPTEAAAPIKVCMVTDSGGLGDKSFNDLTWSGVERGITDFAVEGSYLTSTQPTDFAPNLSACKDAGAKLIVCVGFMMADDCKIAATQNPDIYYAGVDMGGFELANFRGVTALMEQSSYLAGYLSAGMSTSGKVGWYVGIMGPAVQIFGDGWYYGVQKYNEVHKTTVSISGYDALKPGNATATGSWIDADKGRSVGSSMMDEGVDIILPVNGGVGAATAAVMQEKGKGYIIGVDQDWTQTYPQYSAQILASVTKKVDVHIYDAIKRIMTNTWEGGDFVLTLENGGTALVLNPAITVPAALVAEIADLQTKIISGEIVIPAPVAIQ